MDAWQTPDGQKAIDIMGPVEWKSGSERLRLHREGNCWVVQILLPDGCGGWDYVQIISDHEAACLHRDHARHWLNTRDFAAIPVAALGLGATDKDYIDAILAVGKGKK